MRDKPGKPPDAYHSCYVLAGLAGAQHTYEYRPAPRGSPSAAEDEDENEVKPSLMSAFGWKVTGTRAGCWTVDDVVEPVHPIFVIAMDKVEAVRVKYPRDQLGGVQAKVG